MELRDANALAVALMEKHELFERGWKFEFDRARSRFGRCNYWNKLISISKALTELNEAAEVRNTILHEIAHALVGPHHGHDSVWAAKHKEIGGDGKRLYGHHVIQPEANWKAVCSHCGRISYKQRLPKLARHGFKLYACGLCCKKYNHGKFDKRFALTYSPAFLDKVVSHEG